MPCIYERFSRAGAQAIESSFVVIETTCSAHWHLSGILSQEACFNSRKNRGKSGMSMLYTGLLLRNAVGRNRLMGLAHRRAGYHSTSLRGDRHIIKKQQRCIQRRNLGSTAAKVNTLRCCNHTQRSQVDIESRFLQTRTLELLAAGGAAELQKRAALSHFTVSTFHFFILFGLTFSVSTIYDFGW